MQPGTTYANPGINPDYLRPYGGYTNILMEETSGSSKFNSFQLSWNRRMAHGLTFGAAYTREAAHDDSSYRGSGDNLPNAYDRRAVWGNSDFDRPNILVIHYLYELPFLRSSHSLLGKVAGGWSFSGVSQFQSGGWSSITTTDDFAGVGPGSGPQYWVVNGSPTLSRGNQTFSHSNADTNYWFLVTTPSGTPMFTAPANGTYAPAPYGRNIIEQPGFQNWNPRVSRRSAFANSTASRSVAKPSTGLTIRT